MRTQGRREVRKILIAINYFHILARLSIFIIMSNLSILFKWPARSIQCLSSRSWLLHLHLSQSRPQSTISSANNSQIKPQLQVNTKTREISPLAVMPTRLLLRSLMITSVLASPRLLNICLPAMIYMANSKPAVLNPDRNPILRKVIRAVFYSHFCAGENDTEVKKTIATIKDMGFKGVILGYAKEFIVDPTATPEEAARSGLVQSCDSCIDEWREGNLRSLRMLGSGDFLAIK